MTTGLSLPLAYLAGAADLGKHLCWQTSFGPAGRALAELKACGLGAVEIKFGQNALPAQMLAAGEAVLAAGLRLSAHAYLPASLTGRLFGEALPPLAELYPCLRDTGQQTVMVVHAYADKEGGHDALIAATSRSLAGLASRLRAEALPVRIALEINRWHGADTPGVTYEGVMAMAAPLAASEVGLCWDMGHTASSALKGKLDPQPPAAFIRRVIHTHVHGLTPDGQTHHPLTAAATHFVEGIARLRANGYNDILNLELYPERWDNTRSVSARVLESIYTLRGFIAAAAGEL